MTSTADGRFFPEEEPTGKFESETLDALVARSLEKSAMFDASIDGPPVDAIPAPQGPSPSRPEFLGKSTAVLVLPADPTPPKREPAPAPAAAPPIPAPVPTAAEAPVVRTHRRLTARALAKPRRRVWRHVVKLALLALVVLCQPWWWNVGDLSAHHALVTATK
jgi:hypothetical protein